MKTYNYLGKDITGQKICLKSSDYGYVDENNIPHINWGEENDICDANGFSKEHCFAESDGFYIVKDFVLPKGIVLCRYGIAGGRFTTTKDSPYDTLGLPYKPETIEYHEYKVTEDLLVDCYVTKGVVAPKFGSLGGAVQFMHRQPIFLECADGYLQEDFLWKQRNT